MRIRITASNPDKGQFSITHLIGNEYEVVREDADGYYIKYGDSGLYLINENEFEEVREAAQ